METVTLALIALAVLAYGLISRRAERSVVTPPLAFVLFGLLGGSWGSGLLELDIEGETLHLLTEITLVLILFTDASRIDLRLLIREHTLPLRLLLVGLPLTILAGWGLAVVLFPAFSIFTAAVLATMLAPTDAALGQAVVTNPRVPARIRQTLNVESGLNDGMVLPALLIFMSLCAAGHSATPAYWLRFTVLQLTLGPAVGIFVGFVGGKLVVRASQTGWMNHTFQRLCALALSVLAFALAESIGGNGFIAAFVAGMTLGNTAREICGCLLEFGEAEGQLLTLLVFTFFGAALLPTAFGDASGVTWLYAALSLTVVRMVPVALSLIGTRARPLSVIFLGWFGPRGLASILFALLILEEWLVPEATQVANVAYLTVFLSVLAHGLTAAPLARAYGRRVADSDSATMEHLPVSEMPTRTRM